MTMIIYDYANADGKPHHALEFAVLQNVIATHPISTNRAFDIGCGNGVIANMLHKEGFEVTGIDPSPSGISIAKKHFAEISAHVGSSDDDLSKLFGTYPLVYSFETIAHVVNTRLFAKRVYELLESNGVAVISTPFHGYWKNLAISLFNKWDTHANPLWGGRYVSLFSEKTFTILWREAGFRDVKILRVGRFRPLAQSMIAVLQKP